MNPEQMQNRSREKVQEVMALINKLELEMVAREKIDLQTGFKDLVVFWTDHEKYPAADPAPEGAPAEAEAPAPEAQGVIVILNKLSKDGDAKPEFLRAHKFTGPAGDDTNVEIDAWKDSVKAELGLSDDEIQLGFLSPEAPSASLIELDNA